MKEGHTALSPWQRVMISRHPQRPHTIDYIQHICDSFVELHGDRTYRDDSAVVGGFALIGNTRCVILGQEKGKDTETRVKRNFGMLYPEGFRKALRLMKLAEKFHLPVVSLLDTPGAYPGLEAEERGQGWAIANNLKEMSALKTPVVVMVIGEGCSGGALGIGVGDAIGMLEHSYYSVISPEGCASILWKDASKNVDAAAMLKMQAEDLMEFGMIDQIIDEPPRGAHTNPSQVYHSVKRWVIEQIDQLSKHPIDVLLERRYQKFRKMGAYTIDKKKRS